MNDGFEGDKDTVLGWNRLVKRVNGGVVDAGVGSNRFSKGG